MPTMLLIPSFVQGLMHLKRCLSSVLFFPLSSSFLALALSLSLAALPAKADEEHTPSTAQGVVKDLAKTIAQQAITDGLKQASETFRNEIGGASLGYYATSSFLAANGSYAAYASYCGGEIICSILGASLGAILGYGPQRLSSDLYWGFWELQGYVKPPEGLTLVQQKSTVHPDGAVSAKDLIFDPQDPASIKIKSIMKSMLDRQALGNAIYYGDAGTGKSSSIQSFAHVRGYEVYSISGSKMNLEAFQTLTKWLKSASNEDRKILIDISEGDTLLYNIANVKTFKDFFKQNYEASQEHYALVFSCNYNLHVQIALEAITQDNALSRRLPNRIRFSVPGSMVRLSLLQRSVTKALKSTSFENDLEAHNFFQNDLFGNQQYVKDILIPNTDGLSHSQLLTLGNKLVYLYAEARGEMQDGLHPELQQFAFLSNSDNECNIQDPLEIISIFLKDRSSEGDWIRDEKAKIIENEMKAITDELPLLELKEKKRKLLESNSAGTKPASKSSRNQASDYGYNDYYDYDAYRYQ